MRHHLCDLQLVCNVAFALIKNQEVATCSISR
nr:MAG TPA: hypothetical protein [Caudoviricetes sp.]DAR55736.1 MAG TPA: hypothetical protein [Caudoviricetes sp.]DAT72727.1 MAG TPA: hypothetical protein [Caudoviricetes sp.]